MYKSTNLYFYFNTSNNQKETSKTKKINGRTYAFNEKGIMMSGWDPYEYRNEQGTPNTGTGAVYFSKEDDGHQVKKGWVYAVPSGSIDAKAKDDDEEKYMYFNNSGVIVADQFKKINGKYYVFNRTGIMKTGLVIWCSEGTTAGSTVDAPGPFKYVDKLDLDWATGEEVAKKGIYRTDQNVTIQVDADGKVQQNGTNSSKINSGQQVKLHLFGDDGARKSGMNNVEFSDDNYTINTVGASGDKGTGVFAKKYYSLGILLKASQDIRYGIYQTATESMLRAQNGGTDWRGGQISYASSLVDGSYLVLTTSGSKQKGNNTAKKDADGNYWMISSTDNTLKGIFTVGIKESNSLSNFRTKTVVGQNWDDGATITTGELAGVHSDLFVLDYANEKIGNSTRKAKVDFTSQSHSFNKGEVIDVSVTPLTATEMKNFTEISGIAWAVHNITNSNDSYYTTDYQNGPCFQSDYGDGSNKWIPFGMKDNSLKSATFRFADKMNSAGTAVEIPMYGDVASIAYAAVPDGAFQPSNDYFLNCYWNN